MLELFSCRNCVQNCGQSLNIGRGHGFCLQHNSVITEPARTTCKYLQRKDLPRFAVDEAMREHAAEFALFTALVTIDTKEPLPRVMYSERWCWEHGAYDSLTNAIAQYFKTKPAWAFIQSFSGGLDGRRSLTHAAIVRRYMNHCNSWVSSYRLTLAVIQDVDTDPLFDDLSLIIPDDLSPDEVRIQALWDVIFCRLSGIQEYGWHAGLGDLMWASDRVNGGLTELNWPFLKEELAKIKKDWTEMIIGHAKGQDAFLNQTGNPDDEENP